MVPVAIALGSNLGAREAHLDAAVDAAPRAARPTRACRASTRPTTSAPRSGPQPRYLNAALVGHTDARRPGRCSTALLEIERDAGRDAPVPGRAADARPRSDSLRRRRSSTSPGWSVPHPRFRQRRFVLEPLAEIAADWRDPVSGRTVEELLRQLD